MRKLIFCIWFLLCSCPAWAMKHLYVDTDVVGGTGDGSSWANAELTLSAAVGDLPADLTADDSYTIHCKGATADTTAVTIASHTTDATHTITIQTDAADRHAGIWSTSKYRLSVTNAIAIDVRSYFVNLDGLQVEVPTISSNYKDVVAYNYGTYASGSICNMSNCIIRGANNATYYQNGVAPGIANLTTNIWNTIIYNISTADYSYCISINDANTAVNIYNCIFVGGDSAIRQVAGTMVVTNVYAGGSGSPDYIYNTITMTTCASSDITGDIDNIALNTTNFTNVSSGTEDFRLPLGSALIGVGTDGPWLPAGSTDITGATRTSVWDIGADEYITPSTARPIIIGGGIF